MFKILRFGLLGLLMLICGAVAAQEATPCKTLTFPDENKANNAYQSYVTTWPAKIGDDTWTISNFNNNLWGNSWTYIKCGRKSNASVATIMNANAFEDAIEKVVVNIKNATSKYVNSVKLIVVSDKDCKNIVETVSGNLGTIKEYPGDLEFTISNPAKQLFYKLEIDCKRGDGNNNGIVTINSLKYYSKGNTTGVSAPKFSEASKTFSEPFDVTITAEEGADIYYTLDGSTPTTSSTKYTGAINISETTTLKAIAVKGGEETSAVTSATYTYKEALAHDGSFTSPLTPEELIANGSDFSGKEVWVKGKVLGQALNSGNGYEEKTPTSSSIAIGESGLDKCIAIALKNNTNEKTYCNGHATDLMGKEIMFYGTVGDYFGRKGIPSGKVIAFAGPEDNPIASLSVKTDEGYATFVSSMAFYVPEGVVCSTITDAKNGVLTINDKYKAGYGSNNIVPANYPVLVKADGKRKFNLALASGNGASAGTNLLKAGTGSEIEAKAGHCYYKLAYNKYSTREGLGFYWGTANGGAFTVPVGNAYLDVTTTSTTAIQSYRFDDATVTNIESPVANVQKEKVAYTIDGRRVDAAHLTKGLYIVNGKKVMVK